MTRPIKLLSLIEATTVIGPAKNLLDFCRLSRSPEFSREGIPRVEVSIVTFDRVGDRASAGANGDAAPNAFVAAARDAGVTVDVIHERFRFDTRVNAKLREIVDQRAPDIIQTHMIKSHFLIKLTGLGKEYPWIAVHHGYTSTDLKMRVYNHLNRWSLPSAELVITVCDAFAKQLVSTGVRSDRIRVSHNSVVAPRIISLDERRLLREKYGVASDEKIVLAVGRLSREKGHADLIESMSLLRKLAPELKFKLLIVGEGPEQASLEIAIAERHLKAHVVFVGHVSNVAPFYAIADVLALPSHSEGSPNVLLEAMAAGVPVVATSVGGVPEIATTEENALLVASHDPQTFASAMQRMLSDETLAKTLTANAKCRVATDFSPESHARSLIKIYEAVTESRRVGIASGSFAQAGLPVAAAGTDTPL